MSLVTAVHGVFWTETCHHTGIFQIMWQGRFCLLLGKTVCCVMGSNLSHLQRLMTACLFFQRALLHCWQQCWEMTEDDVWFLGPSKALSSYPSQPWKQRSLWSKTALLLKLDASLLKSKWNISSIGCAAVVFWLCTEKECCHSMFSNTSVSATLGCSVCFLLASKCCSNI